jgi:protocatechuate 3,4-dioxygenase beta subunit
MSADDYREWLLSRRKMLTLLGATGISMLTGCSSRGSGTREVNGKILSCIVTPQQTEGPYFVEEHLSRSDIRSDPSDGSMKEGLPLALEIRVSSVNKTDCRPLAGAMVDIWHCDADGIYSDVVDSNFNTFGKKFLRGSQVTDTNGSVRFLTIYPGWYPGRTPHIHFKIRTDPKHMRAYEFTSQLYFDDSISDLVYARQPYARRGPRGRGNKGDAIFWMGGSQLVLTLAQTEQGYASTFDVGLDIG